LLGPNGAGKTTTVQILSTLIGADGGDASVAGHDVACEPDAVRDVIGVTGQFSAVDSLLTGEENLRLMADLRHLERSEGQRRTTDLLERFDLVEEARKPAMTYSGGTRRRLDLAMTWSATRGSSSSTSRPLAWTPAAAGPCGRSSASSSTAGSRSS
jgi:ABC-2 type transport system ATP-binding protein